MTTASSQAGGINGDVTEAVRGLVRATRILERASSELSMPHYRVLASVAAGEERASRVAERLELGRPAVSSAVEALCANGLMERLEVRGDQRAFDLRVTTEGRLTLARVERAMTKALGELCARVDDGEGVLRALGALDGAVDALYAEKRAARRRVER